MEKALLISLQVNKTDVDERTALHWAAYQVIIIFFYLLHHVFRNVNYFSMLSVMILTTFYLIILH